LALGVGDDLNPAAPHRPLLDNQTAADQGSRAELHLQPVGLEERRQAGRAGRTDADAPQVGFEREQIVVELLGFEVDALVVEQVLPTLFEREAFDGGNMQ